MAKKRSWLVETRGDSTIKKTKVGWRFTQQKWRLKQQKYVYG
jgi:hypothetical protein